MPRRRSPSRAPDVPRTPVWAAPDVHRDAGMTASDAELPTFSPRAAKAVLAVLIALFLALGWMYSLRTPAATADQHNPDENAHMLYVASLASGHLPVFRAGEANYEAHQPPLYYALCAPVYAAARHAGPETATRAVRGVSLLLGAALVVAAFLCVCALFPAQLLVALGTAAFIGLLPMNLALSASVSNDALTNLLMALALWRLARAAQDAGQFAHAPRLLWRHALVLGLLIGIGIWTKTSTLLLLPTVACACYFLVKQGLVLARDGGRLALVSLGVGVLLGAPWLLRNQVLYGDPLAQHLFETAFGNTAQAPDLIRYVFGGSMGAYLAGVARWTFASFWGVFDSMRVFWGQDPHGHPPSPAQPLPSLYVLLVLCCLASGAGLWMLARRKHVWTPAQSAMLRVFGVLVALAGLAHLRFVLVFFQAQGRYWYPALLPLALFFVLGLRGLAVRPAAFPLLLGLMTAGLLLLNIDTLAFVLLARFMQ